MPILVRSWAALALALLLLFGHSAGLQVIAWTGMFIGRAPVMGVVAASVSTFGGQAPCGLCKAIRNADQVQATGTTKVVLGDVVKKPDLVPPMPHLLLADQGMAETPVIHANGALIGRQLDGPEPPPPIT